MRPKRVSTSLDNIIWRIYVLTVLTWSFGPRALGTNVAPKQEASDKPIVEEKANKLLVIMLDG